MENLKIIATKSSPEINFNEETNILNIIGESYPENTTLFYEPVFQWIETYMKSIKEQTVTLNIELIYFNSSSSKTLMDLFEFFEDQSDEGKDIIVNWIYDEENEAALEYGEEFAEDVESLTFNLVEK